MATAMTTAALRAMGTTMDHHQYLQARQMHAAAKLHDGHDFGRNELALAHADEPMESVSESENKSLCCRS
jgi:hypothetical protein